MRMERQRVYRKRTGTEFTAPRGKQKDPTTMARKNAQAVAETETFNEIQEDNTVSETNSNVITYKTFSVDVGSLEPRIVNRLLQYGFGKRLQDSVSGLKKQLTTEGNLAADEIDQTVLEAQTAAFNDIIDGSWGTPKEKAPSTPRAPKVATIDSVMRKVATEIVKAKIKGTEHAKTLKGEALQSVITNYIAKHDETVRAEAARRMDAQTDTAGLDDLLNF